MDLVAHTIGEHHFDNQLEAGFHMFGSWAVVASIAGALIVVAYKLVKKRRQAITQKIRSRE